MSDQKKSKIKELIENPKTIFSTLNIFFAIGIAVILFIFSNKIINMSLEFESKIFKEHYCLKQVKDSASINKKNSLNCITDNDIEILKELYKTLDKNDLKDSIIVKNNVTLLNSIAKNNHKLILHKYYLSTFLKTLVIIVNVIILFGFFQVIKKIFKKIN